MTGQDLALRPHRCETVDESWWLTVRLSRAGAQLQAEFRLAGDLRGLRVPAPAPAECRDGLWQHTCFELFVGAADAVAYHELNLAPSGHWAQYAFRTTRVPEPRAPAPVAPRCQWRRADDELAATVVLQLEPLGLAGAPLRVGVAAVLEARGGRLSHWALEHPHVVPDFHDPGAFVVRLT